MNKPVKKPNGCMKTAGWLLTVFSTLFILLCVFLIFSSEEKIDENRAEYAAAQQEYEKALAEYEADSAHIHAEVARLKALIEKAEANGDTAYAEVLTDSLSLFAEPEYVPRGAIGFNIGGAFFLFFAICALVPLVIGIILLVVYKDRKRVYDYYSRNERQENGLQR